MAKKNPLYECGECEGKWIPHKPVWERLCPFCEAELIYPLIQALLRNLGEGGTNEVKFCTNCGKMHRENKCPKCSWHEVVIYDLRRLNIAKYNPEIQRIESADACTSESNSE